MLPRMEFRATLLSGGKAATGIRVPEEVVEGLGGGRRAAVRVTLDGFAYRTTFGTMAGHVMIPVSAAVRADAGLTAGDEVDVVLALDAEPRVLEVPDDLNAALDANPAARAFFDGLSYSNRRRHVLYVEGAKTDETRQRRIAKSVEQLAAGTA
ncbi:MAG: hypothetical protein JWM62_133 [Frankiales bacterium]|nr:hypothetical protein [Frankiales bacterium]